MLAKLTQIQELCFVILLYAFFSEFVSDQQAFFSNDMKKEGCKWLQKWTKDPGWLYEKLKTSFSIFQLTKCSEYTSSS